MANEVYEGRLMADGSGNLLADPHKFDGTPDEDHPLYRMPVAFNEDDNTFTIVKSGDPGHNDKHHLQFVGVTPTQTVDETLPGYAGTPDKPTEGNEHHWGPTEDDAHYDPNSPGNTKIKVLPDRVAAMASGHTDAYKK